MRSIRIGELEHFTAIKAHTIRAWETRFELLKPQRQGISRMYTCEELELFLKIALLNQCGHKISAINKMGAAAVHEKAAQLTSLPAQLLHTVYTLIAAMYKLDVVAFEKILDDCIEKNGCEVVMNNVVIPFLEKTNILSYNDSSLQIHLVVPVIRQKIIVAIEQLPHTNGLSNALLFLPKGAYYDLILLHMSWQLKKDGFNVYYLGTNISKQNLKEVLHQKRPQVLYTYVNDVKSFDRKAYEELLYEFNQLTCYVATAVKTEIPDVEGSRIRTVSYQNLREVAA